MAEIPVEAEAYQQYPAKGAQRLPLFSAHVYCGHGRPSQLLLSSCNLSVDGSVV